MQLIFLEASGGDILISFIKMATVHWSGLVDPKCHLLFSNKFLGQLFPEPSKERAVTKLAQSLLGILSVTGRGVSFLPGGGA